MYSIQSYYKIFFICIIISALSSVFEDKIDPNPSILDQIIKDSSRYYIMVEKSPSKIESMIRSNIYLLVPYPRK